MNKFGKINEGLRAGVTGVYTHYILKKATKIHTYHTHTHTHTQTHTHTRVFVHIDLYT